MTNSCPQTDCQLGLALVCAEGGHRVVVLLFAHVLQQFTQLTCSSCRRRQLRHLLSDTLVALAVILMHGTVIMCQGMAFSVAMNSKRSSALVALLIASNFVEIKGNVGSDYLPSLHLVHSNFKQCQLVLGCFCQNKISDQPYASKTMPCPGLGCMQLTVFCHAPTLVKAVE